ncbi:MAG: NADH:flavin oxidoreductase, partial [Planctomycetota bacterium]|nr:NADH:flavin oxidoreductase [Planctomycetota bacterium]
MAIRHPLPDPGWPSAETAARSRLFSPLRVGDFTASSRTWVPAMVPWRATDEGFVTPDVLAWYRRFAEGRPGVIVVEATGIREVPSGPLLRAGHDRFVPGLAELTRAVHEASAGETRILIQLIDFLRIRRRPRKEDFLARFLTITDRHRERVGVEDEAALRARLAELPHEELLDLLAPS